MIDAMLAAYQWWPFRPHCSAERHVLLCRLIVPHLDGKPCPARDLPRPPGVSACDPGRPRPGYPQ